MFRAFRKGAGGGVFGGGDGVGFGDVGGGEGWW